MLTLLRHEINTFFSSLTGYITLVVFLSISGLFLWVFPDTEYNVLSNGYSTLEGLFNLAPWLFMFLIPAVTMRSFSEEIKSGTYEIIATKPLSDLKIVLSKYIACVLLTWLALLPTLVYYFTVHRLGVVAGNIDTGATMASYFGLGMLSAGFCAVGVFASAITSNQIVAFIVGLLLCFTLYNAFFYISQLPFFVGWDNVVQQLGIQAHYISIRRGVLDSRDVLYFASIIGLFILFTKTAVESRKW